MKGSDKAAAAPAPDDSAAPAASASDDGTAAPSEDNSASGNITTAWWTRRKRLEVAPSSVGQAYIYRYIIYTSNLGSFASVLGPEREQGRFNQARERTAKGTKKKNSEKAKKKHKKEHRRSFWLSIIIVQSCIVFVSVKTAA